ncbi:MAG: carboxypeptidase regulatory-like domain-containing protein [Bryobacterales bacterium]|nr:carboxypeptidase regulatory-like domain-containing protein [Bryobacterales bacterium]
MHRRAVFSFLLLLLAGAVSLYGFQGKKNKEEANVRMVQGTVSAPDGNSVQGAVVQIKNTKSLQIRSFITNEHGAYYFHNLDTNVDYELRAEHQGSRSPVRTLSAFDTRKQPVINLTLEKK